MVRIATNLSTPSPSGKILPAVDAASMALCGAGSETQMSIC